MILQNLYNPDNILKILITFDQMKPAQCNFVACAYMQLCICRNIVDVCNEWAKNMCVMNYMFVSGGSWRRKQARTTCNRSSDTNKYIIHIIHIYIYQEMLYMNTYGYKVYILCAIEWGNITEQRPVASNAEVDVVILSLSACIKCTKCISIKTKIEWK